MALDYIALWILTVVNSFAIILIVRQLAALPNYSQTPGPRLGSVFGEWELKTLAGETRSSSEMPPEYVMLFAAEHCGPCHVLFAQLGQMGRPGGHLVIAAEGDAAALSRAASTPSGPLYDELLSGVDGRFMRQFNIPGTPYGLAVRQGRIVASGPARSSSELQKLADVLRPAIKRPLQLQM